jgi:hypothetical protein
MERVRQIAATGIDGIYVDIPYWMTHFDGWEDTWASFDDYTVAAFKNQTGRLLVAGLCARRASRRYFVLSMCSTLVITPHLGCFGDGIL